ncbi:MAG TPA: efflux RND transporter periplasmic adaptor subunit [Opitutaceae bacterium]|nr:efflux RND transporter periplasmic adaptor subunit [Opitutaceae bacterium]HPG17716.1 efflux RND transporter periplasmic adaptor subunit [Opitutaceae bacterium]
MSSRSLLIVCLIAALAASAGWWVGHRAHTQAPAAATARKVLYYQSPMHPWIKSDQPGQCTICGMTLVPVYEGETGFSAQAGLVELSPSALSVIGVQTTEVRRQPLARTLTVSGTIDDDDTRHRLLVARAPGRVEKLFVNHLGAEVRAGQPLLTLYSPTLLTAQREFLEIVRGGTYTADALPAARARLVQAGLDEKAIDALVSRGEPEPLTTLVAPYEGTVVTRDVYEGQQVELGARLFEIADFSTMWFQFEAYEQDLPWLRIGQTVTVTTKAAPGKTFTAPIRFIDPNLDAANRFARVRVELPNPPAGPDARRELPHRVYAEGRVQLDAPEALAVPRSAVLRSGAGDTVYVERATGTYEARPVRLGRAGDSVLEVLDGLRAGEKVVTQGALLIDAQAALSYSATSDAPQTTEPKPAADNDVALSTLAGQAASAATALAADELTAFQTLLPQLRAAAQPFPELPPLNDADTLDAARQNFAPWSTAVADLVRPHATHLGWHVIQCPMVPGRKESRWLQREKAVQNPFFGSAMPDCGEVVE